MSAVVEGFGRTSDIAPSPKGAKKRQKTLAGLGSNACGDRGSNGSRLGRCNAAFARLTLRVASSVGAPRATVSVSVRVGLVGESVAMWSSFRCRGLDRACAVLFSFILAGCAARPGPEVLTPVAASSGEKALQIYVATTREREISSGNVFTANLANTLNFAKFVVSVPPNHKSGNVEMPTATPDPRSSFAVVDQAVMSEAEFRKA